VQKCLTIPSDELRAGLDDRRYSEPKPSTRSEAQRDRDRILYCSAFLRLGHITQVAAPEVGHTFHSRLTHSIKVGQVARGLAQRFKTIAAMGELDDAAALLVDALDEDATEAAALGHDLGHPPFGHLAERVLQHKSKQGNANFEGNPQSFRIVTRLARRDPTSPGLNLTRRTLNGLLKYPWLWADEPQLKSEKWGAYSGDREDFEWARQDRPESERTLEAELMDWADDVTYAVHDLDDFYRAGLVPLDRLTTESQEKEAFQTYLRQKHPASADRLVEAADRLFDGFVSSIRTRFLGRQEERVNLRALGSALIGRYIAATVLRDSGDGRTVFFEVDERVRDEVTVLKELTWFYIIKRPSLAVIQRGQSTIIEQLYDFYRDAIADDRLEVFSPGFLELIDVARAAGKTALERVVIDLIAGMTESSATEIYREFTGISGGSLLVRAAGPA
jgi:dGTPase